MIDKPLPPLDYHQPCGLAIQGWEFENTQESSKKSSEEEEEIEEGFPTMSPEWPPPKSVSKWDAVFDPNHTFHLTRGGTEYKPCSPLTTSPVVQSVWPSSTQADGTAPRSVDPTVPTVGSRDGSIYAEALESQNDMEGEEEDDENEEKKRGYYLDILRKIRDVPSFDSACRDQQQLQRQQQHQKRPSAVYESGLRLVATKNTMMSSTKRPIVLEQRLFWFGFLCPLLWLVALCRNPRANTRRRLWRMRCGRAATLFGLSCLCCIIFWIIYKAIAKGRRAQPIASVVRS
ncbi:hypothetical protein EC973_005769 [Apophysomyces ossiformis]|uniref:Uncharacterized protein n=1 Tax=Apophysomyces ossiformis TaxID=679940 RepID=A0A8H7ELW9_9FUNG|nr:hypothetical protein EC973_005769 [Apophysomyces ossiformis]